MDVAITIKNIDKGMIKAIKAMLETSPAIEFDIKQSVKKPNKRLKKAIDEVNRGEVLEFTTHKAMMEYLRQ